MVPVAPKGHLLPVAPVVHEDDLPPVVPVVPVVPVAPFPFVVHPLMKTDFDFVGREGY